ncbi:MAG: hypothetical protein ACREB9_05040 [Thermoplasmata archaeon]
MAVIIVAAGVAAAVVSVYVVPTHQPHGVKTVAQGDNATVNYIGMFASGPQQGRVFDTSLYSVSLNNATYPKALEYVPRGAESNYTVLPVHVGSSAPTHGYVYGNYTFSTVVTGFWQGMLGMTGNQTRIVTIPVDLAYGPANPGCFAPEPLVQTVPVYSTIPLGTFRADNPNVTATTGATIYNSLYGWTEYILSANATTVSLQSLASVGERVTVYGLPYIVSAIANGNITVTSTLTVAQAGTVRGTLPASAPTICNTGEFIVSSINPTSGTMTWNFNNEIYGQPLTFFITVVDIFPAGA